MSWIKKVPVLKGIFSTKVLKEETQVVPVRDIKQYLVDEYERCNKLELTIKQQEEIIEILQETKLKYDASLVTLEEYKNRIEKREEDIEDCKIISEIEEGYFRIKKSDE